MTEYKIENQGDKICLTILNCGQSGCATYFIGITGLFIFLLPIVIIIILSIEVSFGTMLVCLVAWLIFGYLFRLFLWNKYGKEVFLVSRGRLDRYNDYKLYKDNQNSYEFSKIDVLYFLKNTGFSIYDLRDLDSDLIFNSLSIIGFDLDGEIIISHKEIAITDIVDIALKIEYITSFEQ
ncbi:hypothetical protein [Dysgonomonas sp. GY617]|uniref:hypothetical protein n=1 Tax=Dysgonomonas sp. GY617 TaxID=2780420 RepID=UPI0018839030|nr:hypothetical protein [Dysgonomonas sp. GY617]MBF0575565.1 hypothetical protein [Dysgonomonas sp. GY617]